jgi:hypothetical protein
MQATTFKECEILMVHKNQLLKHFHFYVGGVKKESTKKRFDAIPEGAVEIVKTKY